MFAPKWRRPGSARAPGRRRLRPGVEILESRRLLSGPGPDRPAGTSDVSGTAAGLGVTQAAVRRADWTVMFYVTASNLEAESAAYVERLEQEAARLPGTVDLALLYDQAGGQVPITDAHGNPAGTRAAIEFATGGG